MYNVKIFVKGSLPEALREAANFISRLEDHAVDHITTEFNGDYDDWIVKVFYLGEEKAGGK